MLRFVVHVFLWTTVKIFEIAYWPIKAMIKLRRPKRCPPITDKLLLIPAIDLAEGIRTKQISSETIVKVYIKRIKEVNPILNAVVDDRFGSAIQEAKGVDLNLEHTNLTVDEIKFKHPLLGVPVTIKESIALQGLSFNAGITGSARKNAVEDADVVKLIKQAGGIPILVSNTPEFCMSWETVNKYTGTTRNPYDTRRTCGGSSGGEAVLLASGASVVGVGSDVCGSLRLPPSFCGVYGHKPSPGVVSNEGNIPSCKSKEVWNYVLATGPMSRYAVDLPLMLGVMARPEAKNLLRLKEEVDVKKLKIFYMEYDGGSYLTHTVHPDIVVSMRKLVNRLKVDGFQIKNVTIKKMSDSPDLAFVLLLCINDIDDVFATTNRGVFVETLKTLVCSSNVQPTCLLFNVISRLAKCLASKERLAKLQKEVDELRTHFREMLKDDGVFLYPAFPNVAHFHGEVLSKALDSSYMAIFNVLGLPVTSCPIGFNSDGLPIGIQIVANAYMDHLCFAMAKTVEEKLGGWIPPKFTK